MHNTIIILLLLTVVFAFCLSGNGVYAFGAGNIPSFAYMEGRAYRHGDIEDVLADLVKRGSSFALTAMISKGHKFNGLDIKRVYFGNWLRDYSQALDIASLKKMPQQTIMNLLMVLGFMAHGYATHEFEVTFDRIGVYLPVEHIDNPKGYGEGEDPRKYHPNLRGPVNPQELEIDPRTGMKNYIANENGNWDTSKRLIRGLLERTIHLGRKNRAEGQKQDEYEGLRLLGTLLHTLEDFTAHSNWCELALVMMGHRDVFLHVGDQVRVQAPNGKWVAPIVTGTFGSNDFVHSLLGEATDHLSQASVTDLNKSLDNARSRSRSGPGGVNKPEGDILRDLFFSIPGGEGSDMSRELESVERIRAGPEAGGKRPEDMSPQELHAVLWQVLTFRDSVAKKISKTIEKIPGLGPLIDKIMDSISVFIFTTLEPFLKPILKTTTAGLSEISGEVINSHDQFEVFNDPRASDPTHSFLSKDHFNLILNEPAGLVAKTVVVHTVNLITKAWDDPSANIHAITEDVLQSLFHPEFHNPNSKVQREMLQTMRNWVEGLGKHQHKTLQRLTKAAVRNHENIRLAGEGGKPAVQGSYAQGQGLQAQQALLGYANQIPGVSQAQQFLGGGGGKKRGEPGDGSGYDEGGVVPQYGQQGQNQGPPMAGQAASYYGGGSEYLTGGPPPQTSYAPPTGPSPQSHASYAPPSGPPPPLHSHHSPSGYAPPSGPPPFAHSPSSPAGYAPPSGPPSFPGSAPSVPQPSYTPSYQAPQAPHQSGYAPSYTPSYSSPPPSFPGAAPTFPGSPPPSFPGAAPAFPGAQNEHGHGHGGYTPHAHAQGHNSGAPGFPDAPAPGW